MDAGAGRSWIEQTADAVERYVREKKGAGSRIICASGISPSGPVHLGNLREAITVHLVCEELKLRGWQTEHIHSWDDFDRFRKVPVGLPPSFAEHIGKPLCDIPDPYGADPSYSYRFRQEFEQALADLGIQPRTIVQSEAYRKGVYTAEIIRAIERRYTIFDILSEYQTSERSEKDVGERREEYYPIRVYCETCGKDDTQVKGFEPDNAVVRYECQNCKGAFAFSLFEKVPCKLVWKADWPMRWSYERVDFEPAGEDHAAPGSSYMVGKRIIREVYGDDAPYFIPYAFVGMAGRSKMSSSAGTTATPRAALDILEPPIVRWLYARKNPMQKFNIDFGQEVLRLYDEWDAFETKITSGNASHTDRKIYDCCVKTSLGAVNKSKIPVSFRLLSSAADITQGNAEQILRIAADQAGFTGNLSSFNAAAEPRLTCAVNWATRYLPEDERTHIREGFSAAAYASLDEASKKGLEILSQKLDENWTLENLTQLIYRIPKELSNLSLDTEPTNELKQAQRQFFKAIYGLICGSETGPRIPTLFLSLGQRKVKELLSPGETA